MKRLPVVWALAGVVALFLLAVVRLGWRGVVTVRGGLTPLEWGALAVLFVAFVYGEGVRALERRWAPTVVDRARELPRVRSPLLRLLAPLYAMALLGASRRALTRAWAGVFAIAVAVALIRALPDPWRGMVDLSVAAALAWGMVGIFRAASRAPDPSPWESGH